MGSSIGSPVSTRKRSRKTALPRRPISWNDDSSRRSAGWLAAFGMMFVALTLSIAAPAQAADVPNIAAASDLQFALPDIVAAFRRATGDDVRSSFGSSGNFRQQIADGAPFELFLSADASYVEALAREQRTVDEGVVYAIGRLALFVPNGSPIEPDPQLRDVAAAIADGRLRKFAIANPEHAPYGRAAQQVLTHAGLWKAIEPHLVLGENISQAAQFSTTGAAQAGIVAYSLVRSPAMAGKGRYVVLPASQHDPLVQRMALLRGAGTTARAFYAFLQQSTARAILERYGFELPPQPTAATRTPAPA
jgi:molybdate transport system substrate-binding protein